MDVFLVTYALDAASFAYWETGRYIKSAFAFVSLELLDKPALFLTTLSDAGQVQSGCTLNLIRILGTLSRCLRQ